MRDTDFDEQRSLKVRGQSADGSALTAREYANVGAHVESVFRPSMLTSSHQNGRGTSAKHAATMQRAQQLYGNRAVQRRISGQAATQLAARPVAVQRSPLGDTWDFLKKMTGVESIGPAVGKVIDKTRSGVESGLDTVFDWLGVGKEKEQPPDGANDAPAGGGGFEPYMDLTLEDAMISGYQM